MALIVTELLTALGPIWKWITTTFVPATVADVTLIHVALWSGFLMTIMQWMLGLVFKRGRR